MTMNFSYLRDIYGHTHIVRFIFFLVDKNKAVVANALSSEELSILWSRTYKKLADKNYSCDMILLSAEKSWATFLGRQYRPTLISRVSCALENFLGCPSFVLC